MLTAVLAALLLAGADPAPAEAQQLKEAGDRRRAAGDAEGARQAYLAAVAAFGGYAEAHEALGEVLFSEKRLSEGRASFERAVEIEPGLALAWYNLGYTARRLGDLGRSRDAWRRYLELRPDDLDARLGLAESLRDLGEREAALEAYRAFVDRAQPTPEEARRVEKARQAMAILQSEMAAAEPPAPAPSPAPTPSPATASPPVSTALPAPAPAAIQAPSPAAVPPGGAPAVAAPTSTPAASDPPRPPAVAPAPARPVIIEPVPAEIPVPAPAPSLPGDPRSARQEAARQKLHLGDRLLAEGDVRLALFAFQDAVNQDPQSAEARLKLGRVYLRLDHLEEALEQFGIAAALDPGDGEVRRALEDARARREGRPPPRGSPVIVRLPPGGDAAPAPPPAAAPPAPSP